MSDLSLPSSTAPRAAPARPAATPAAEKAREFEAVFLTQMVDQMMGTVKIGGIGSGGHAEEMWRGVLAQAVADEIAGQGRTGLAQGVETAISAYRKGDDA